MVQKNLKAILHQSGLNGIILESYCPPFPFVHHVCILNFVVCVGTVPIIALKSTSFFAYQLTFSNCKNKVDGNLGF